MKFLAMFFCCALCAAALYSCGDDDEEDTPLNIDENQVKLIDLFGNPFHVYAYGDYILSYDDKGNLTGWQYPNESPVTLKGGKYVHSGYFEDDIDEDIEYSFSTNKAGLITKARLTMSYTDGYSEDWTMSWDYNESNQCIALKGSCKYTDRSYDADDYIETGTEDISVNYEWKNGNLTKAVYKSKDSNIKREYDDLYNSTDKETITAEYSYGSTKNPLCQVPASIAGWLTIVHYEVGGIAPLALTGLFGKGPAYLPTKLTRTYEEYGDDKTRPKKYTYDDTDDISITLNTNGTIASENGYRYSYSPVPFANNQPRSVKKSNRRRYGLRPLKRILSPDTGGVQ